MLSTVNVLDKNGCACICGAATTLNDLPSQIKVSHVYLLFSVLFPFYVTILFSLVSFLHVFLFQNILAKTEGKT